MHATLRQAAQLLNSARDSEVLVRVFSRVRAHVKDESPRTKLESLHKLLLQERRSATSNALPLRAVRTLLMQSRARSREWLVINDLDLLTTGMQRTYRNGRARYRAACESRTDEQFHAWRRQVKYCAYQLEALGSLAPARMRKRLRRTAKLGKVLGRDHDLCLLSQRVADAHLDAAATLLVANAIKHERAKLQRQALELGKRLYRAKARNFQPLN